MHLPIALSLFLSLSLLSLSSLSPWSYAETWSYICLVLVFFAWMLLSLFIYIGTDPVSQDVQRRETLTSWLWHCKVETTYRDIQTHHSDHEKKTLLFLITPIRGLFWGVEGSFLVDVGHHCKIITGPMSAILEKPAWRRVAHRRWPAAVRCHCLRRTLENTAAGATHQAISHGREGLKSNGGAVLGNHLVNQQGPW